MGRIIEVNTEELKPIQEYLDPTKMDEVLQFYRDGRENDLLPVTARISYDEIFALDGTHRSVIRDILPDRKIQVYVPENERDFMIPEMFSRNLRDCDPEKARELISNMNINIEYSFEAAPAYSLALEMEEGIATLEDIREKHRIFTMEDAEAFARDEMGELLTV